MVPPSLAMNIGEKLVGHFTNIKAWACVFSMDDCDSSRLLQVIRIKRHGCHLELETGILRAEGFGP